MYKEEIERCLAAVPEDRKAHFTRLRDAIREHIPDGFEESYQYGMISYVVPHSVYPPGYHVDPSIPLPFISISNRKNFIALYHMGIYADGELLQWFEQEYPKHSKRKLDMGKSCIRFKKPEEIPFELLEELFSKMTADKWVTVYEAGIKSK